jgi:hypothetical protein
VSDRVQTAKTIADLAWTGLCVMILAYSFRDPIRRAIAAQRAELDASRLAAATRARSAQAQLRFADWTRARLVAGGTDPLIAAIVTAPDAPRES